MFPANNLENFLEKYFEDLDKYRWTLIPVNIGFASKLQKSAENKLNSNQFKTAGITHSTQPLSEIRNDSIFWLDAKLNTLADIDIAALQQLDTLTTSLKNYFRISLSEFECHYAVYPAGHFYKKHQDITTENNKRIFSFVIYLNDSWRSDDGGQLKAYDRENCLFEIPPNIGKMVLFRSELEHEVLTTHKTRYSLTGWIRK